MIPSFHLPLRVLAAGLRPSLSVLLLLCQLGSFAQDTPSHHPYPPVPFPERSGSFDPGVEPLYLEYHDLINGTVERIELPRNAWLNEARSPGYNPHPALSDPGTEGQEVPLEGGERIFGALTPADQQPNFPNYPFSAITKLNLNYVNGTAGSCSGAMIGPSWVTTAGHCVTQGGVGANGGTVVPGYNMFNEPWGPASIIGWWSFNAWINNNDWNYDVALVQLGWPIGNTTGWLGYSYNTDNSWFMNPGQVLNSIGYPATDNWGNPVFEQGERMYAWQGYMDYVEGGHPNALCHYNSGYHGQSGSALYWKDVNQNRYATGALSHGDGATTCHTKFDGSWFDFVFDMVSDVDEESAPRLSVFPDPATDELFVKGLMIGNDRPTYRVVDLLGKQQGHGSLPSPNSIDVRALAVGEYVLELMAGEKIYRTRFVKQ